MWAASTILLGFYSFMLDSDPTLGSVESTIRTRKKYAALSLEFNCRNKDFCDSFPEYVQLYESQLRKGAERYSQEQAIYNRNSTSLPDRAAMHHQYENIGTSSQRQLNIGIIAASIGVSIVIFTIIVRFVT